MCCEDLTLSLILVPTMQSHLRQSIFRALIAERSYNFPGCQRRIPHWRQNQHVPLRLQRRPIFGFALRGDSRSFLERNSSPANVEKALGLLVDLVRALRSRSKLPALPQVRDALNFLFRAHLEHPRRFSRNEVFLATESFKHIQVHEKSAVNGPAALSDKDLQNALAALTHDTGRERFRSDTKSLAYILFQELRDRAAQRGEDFYRTQTDGKSQLLDTYISILASTGGALEALALLRKNQITDAHGTSHWTAVIKGLATEGLEKQALDTLSEMQGVLGLLDAKTHEDLTTFFASNDNVTATKRLYETEIHGQALPTIKCRASVLEFCARNNQIGWGEPIFQSLLGEPPSTTLMDAIVVWYSALGFDAPQIAAMISTAAPGSQIEISTINKAIGFDYSVNNPKAANGMISLAQKSGIKPNAHTFLLQLDYRLKIKDLVAAKAIYELLVTEDLVEDNSDVPVLNKFLATIAFSPRPDFDLTMRIVDSLLDRGAYLEAETISGLCHLFLHRNEFEEAMGLLRHRVDFYPMHDRARIAQVFREFILDPGINDQRAFNAYELFRHAFPETPPEMRLPLMHSFFHRKRPDLACLVFGHMRQREDPDGRPTPEAYAQCFEGIAKCKNIDSLQIVYNMLKLDLEVEQTTRIHNGLMVAYTACDMPFTAIIDHFWKIMDSREGPTFSSFALALRACETWVPQGAQEARRIIAMMQAWKLDITKEIYLCYIGALAGQSEFENTVELIEEMETDIGEKPDAYT